MKHCFRSVLITRTFYILISLSICLTVLLLIGQQKLEAANSEILQGSISKNELIDNLEGLGIKCVIHEGAARSSPETLTVDTVRLGSSAYYGDILKGDTIKDLHRLNANTFALTIERAGKIYQTNLRAIEGILTDEIAERKAKSHMLAGVEYARNLLYGHNTMLNTGTESTELTKQIASIEAMKSATLLQGQETKNLLHGNASIFGLSSNIMRFPAHIEMLNPYKASFLNINLCMAPPIDPYGKLQWNSLIAERNMTSPLGPAWDAWERNIGDYICRDWATSSCSSQGVVVFHVVLKNNGELGEIKLMPVAELSANAGDNNMVRCGVDLIKKLNGSAILFFPQLTQVKELHLEIGLINKGDLKW